MTWQKTIKSSIASSGIGIHSGKNVNIRIRPAPVNHGIRFIRTDLPHRPCIAALFNHVVDTSLATVVGSDGCIVSTIEHLMATFSGMRVDNALVEVDAYEMPIMDGSAQPFAALIAEAGTVVQAHHRWFIKVNQPIELKAGDKFVGLYPLDHFRITYTIDYPHPLIQKQSYSLDLSESAFFNEISGARTFGFLQEYETLKRFGLARGGSLDNVVVIADDAILNPSGLRFPDEPVRHKILDCIGDFSLLGMPIMGHVVAEKAGHTLNHLFINKLFSERSRWETCTLENSASAPHAAAQTA